MPCDTYCEWVQWGSTWRGSSQMQSVSLLVAAAEVSVEPGLARWGHAERWWMLWAPRSLLAGWTSMKEFFCPWSNVVLSSIETLSKHHLSDWSCAVIEYMTWQESWLQPKFILVKFQFERESQKNLDLHGFGFKSGTPLPWPLPWKSKCWIFAIPSANWDHLWQISRDKSRWQIWILPTWGLPGREELEHIARWLPRIYCRHSI